MSNLTSFLVQFGPLPASPQLQRPIHHAFLLILDFCLLPRSFDVQFTTVSCSFWTSTMLPHSFNVQSTTISCSFWTSTMPPAASTSNPPRFLAPFGLLPCLPQLQRPIHHAFLLILDFCLLPRSFDVQFTTVSCSF